MSAGGSWEYSRRGTWGYFGRGTKGCPGGGTWATGWLPRPPDTEGKSLLVQISGEMVELTLVHSHGGQGLRKCGGSPKRPLILTDKGTWVHGALTGYSNRSMSRRYMHQTDMIVATN